MTSQVFEMLGAACVVVLAAAAFLWHQLPILHWYCGRCEKVVSSGRFHPRRCACGVDSLSAYICRICAGWNTLPASSWPCRDCSSKEISVGVEYQFGTQCWKWRNQTG